MAAFAGKSQFACFQTIGLGFDVDPAGKTCGAQDRQSAPAPESVPRILHPGYVLRIPASKCLQAGGALDLKRHLMIRRWHNTAFRVNRLYTDKRDLIPPGKPWRLPGHQPQCDGRSGCFQRRHRTVTRAGLEHSGLIGDLESSYEIRSRWRVPDLPPVEG